MKKHAPATLRNREPIAAVLREELPGRGLVLEIASGSGEHALHFAPLFPGLRWQPSDYDADALASISAWRDEAGIPNILRPLPLDASTPEWPVTTASAIFCANMIHLSPPEVAEGLLAGAGRLLSGAGPLILYGPFIEECVETAPSNLDFDASLRSRDPSWGIRKVAWIDQLAAKAGLMRTRRIAMPANNLILVYRPA